MSETSLRRPPIGVWPWGPLLSGSIYKITDPLTFFLQILAGQGPPPAAYQPWPGLEVTTWSVNDLFPILFPGGSATTQADGGFSINQTPPNPVLGAGGSESDVRFSLLVREGSFPFRPLYRSGLGLSVAGAETTELNIWLLPQSIDDKDGMSAGSISSQVSGKGLPGNTQITAGASGLAFSGSSSGANIQFGISITPDTSFDLNTFLDLQLTSWNINVGWPADWCTNADDILVEINQALQSAAASMNKSVLTRMEAAFADQENLPVSVIQTLLSTDASVTFMDLTFPVQHSWPVSNTTDPTVVVTGDLCVGYPRNLSSDPSRTPVFEARRLSRLFRPVLI